jgi:hypothetical protein
MKTLVRNHNGRWGSAYMVRKVSIHDNHKVPGNEIQAVNVCCPVPSLSYIPHSDNKAYPNPSFPARGLRTYRFHISD